MNASTPITSRSVVTRIGLVVLSVLSLLGGVRLAVATEGPLELFLGLLAFAAYVVLFSRAVDGPALRGQDFHG